MSSSSWLIGSICGLPTQAITVDANGAGAVADNVDFTMAGTYLDHATAALSMVEQLQVTLLAQGVTNALVFLTQSGYVRITADVSFEIVWTDTALRDALGFTGTVTDVSAPFDQTAPLRSEYLWVPRREDSPMKAVVDATGAQRHNTRRFQASDGTQVTRTFGDPVRENIYEWRTIDKGQFWTSDELGGELFAFFDKVLSPGANVNLHREVSADYSLGTAVTIGTALGPYASQSNVKALPMKRTFANVDKYFDFSWDALKVPEYT